jgi:hypothetical protein
MTAPANPARRRSKTGGSYERIKVVHQGLTPDVSSKEAERGLKFLKSLALKIDPVIVKLAT